MGNYIEDKKIVKERYNNRFGIWWIKREDEKYYISQTEETKDLFGINVTVLKREALGVEWQQQSRKVLNAFPEFEEFISDISVKFSKLVSGEIEDYIHTFPWIDANNNFIWIENQLRCLIRDESNIPTLIVAASVDITERINMTVSMSKLKKQFTQLENINTKAIDLAKMLVWKTDYRLHPNGELFFANERYKKTLGLKNVIGNYIAKEDFYNSGYPDEEGQESFANLLKQYHRCLNNEIDEFYGVIAKHINFQTNEAVYLIHNTKVDERDSDGNVMEISGYITNVTDSINMEKVNKGLLEQNTQLLRAYELAVKSGKVIIWYVDNRNMEKGYYFGNDLHSIKLGIKKRENGFYLIDDFQSTVYLEDDEGIELNNNYHQLKNQVEKGLNSFEKVVVKHYNLETKEIIYLEHNFEADKRDSNGELLTRGGFMTDVTEEVSYQKQNEYLMKYDSMTDLKNRNSFETFISSNELPSKYSLIIVDIDGLKFINDAFGHLMGDKAIKFTASKLKEEFLSTSNLFRIGGDEYAIISTIIDYDLIEHKLSQIKKTMNDFYLMNNISINISSGIQIVDGTTDFTEAFIDAENVMYRRKLTDRSSRKSRTMEAVLETLNQKTEETNEHCQRMSNYAVKLMKKIGYNRTSDFDDMVLLCKVHDIGKITVSEELLSKPDKLTKEEYAKIRSHSEAGYKIIRNIVDSEDIAYGVLYHHERIDGKGYPFGLTGDEIPAFAKIVSICDAFDVMISGRPYSKTKTISQVIEDFKMNAGTQFDANLVELFIEILKEEKL